MADIGGLYTMGVVMGILGGILVACKYPQEGHFIWLFSNLMLIFVGIAKLDFRMSVLFTVYETITIIGLINWSRKK